jgi:hypothetical protein
MSKVWHYNSDIKKILSEKTREKYYSCNSFFFFSFSVCCFANSNSSLVCLNFFNSLVCDIVYIKTAVFFSEQIMPKIRGYL